MRRSGSITRTWMSKRRRKRGKWHKSYVAHISDTIHNGPTVISPNKQMQNIRLENLQSFFPSVFRFIKVFFLAFLCTLSTYSFPKVIYCSKYVQPITLWVRWFSKCWIKSLIGNIWHWAGAHILAFKPAAGSRSEIGWPNSKSAISGLDAEGSRGFIKVGRRPWHFAKHVFNSFVQQPLQFATCFARRNSFLCQIKDLKASRISFQIVVGHNSFVCKFGHIISFVCIYLPIDNYDILCVIHINFDN